MARRRGNRHAESRFKHFQVLWYGWKIPILRIYADTIARASTFTPRGSPAHAGIDPTRGGSVMTGAVVREFLWWWWTLMLDVGADAAWLVPTEWLGWMMAMGACGNLPCWT